MILDSTYVAVSWHQEFLDEQGGAIHCYEFKIPPATIAVGDFVKFSFSNDKGRVTSVSHYFTDSLRPGSVENPHLHHYIQITIDTNAEVNG